MTLSTQKMRASLQAFDFKRLFVEALGWNNTTTRLAPTEIAGVSYSFASIAQQGGMVVMTCTASDGNIPPSGARSKIDKYVTALAFEHLILFLDQDMKGEAQTSLWWWVKREDGKIKPRIFTYRRGAMGDALLQKLAGIAFDLKDLDDEGRASIGEVTTRVKKAFDVESVTKKFYDQFKTEHDLFAKFLSGIDDQGGRDWYISVMLNRLMFLYFIQKKRFLNGDPDYLRTKLAETQAAGANFYRDFLLILFFQGLAQEAGERDATTNHLLGNVPYLNGGLFLPHAIEDQYGDTIQIADEAFERLFTFFDGYTWHLDERPLRQGNEINPDVLGYIFEKYINQKQMGAYYTKEDITGYICRSTILPFLLDKCGVEISAMLTDVEPYIYDAVATDDYLPTETGREYTARRARYESIKADFAAGKITTVDDLVTYNLDMQTLVEDWLHTLSDPVLLRRFYFECLSKLTVLDPTCGSGAFLFAAINILEPLYELALDKMRQIVGAPEDAPTRPNARENVVKYLDFVDELKRVSAHPNRRYYVLKRIIVDNLYGVDIMDEAVEICKLRLFLKMVAQVEDAAQIEPLPDIDFNIRAGNTLVGFATRGEIEGRLFATPELKRKVEAADRDMGNFRDLQTRVGVESGVFKRAKADIQAQLTAIRADLDASLMDDYGLTDLPAFRASHKPFHWYVEFNSVLANGGFDVIVGNPPYVEYSKVRKEYTIRGYETEKAGNLYAYTLERSAVVTRHDGRIGMIVPISFSCTQRMQALQNMLLERASASWISHFGERPSKLFEGAEVLLNIVINHIGSDTNRRIFSTGFTKWQSVERETLFANLNYANASRIRRYLIPKFQASTESDLWTKITQRSMLAKEFRAKSDQRIFYRIGGGRYWKIFTNFQPRFVLNGQVSVSSRENYLYFASEENVLLGIAALSSSLFYWYFIMTTNCRDLNPYDLQHFPIGISDMELDTKNDLLRLTGLLMQDYKAKSQMKPKKSSKTGNIEYQEFYPRLSKPIIDEIDRVLARHYGFTDAELDFIIHYDIKYRMGRDAEVDGEGDEA